MNRLLAVALPVLVLASIALLAGCGTPEPTVPVATEPTTPATVAVTPTVEATSSVTATPTVTATFPPPPTPPGDLGYLDTWPSGLPLDPGGHITEVLAAPTIGPIQVTLYQVNNMQPDPGTTHVAGNCYTVDSRPNATWANLPLGPQGAPSTLVASGDLTTFDKNNNQNPMPILLLAPKYPKSGQYGWNYYPGRCYFVVLQRPGVTPTIVSPVVGVTAKPVDDLDFCLYGWPGGQWGSGKAPPPYKLNCPVATPTPNGN